MATYFISDLHLGHENIIRLCERPFSDVDEMNKKLIKNWNNKVTAKDDVYIIGDIAYRSKEDVSSIVNQLNGRKHLIIGNHDEKNLKNPKFRDCFVSIDRYLRIVLDNKSLILCHYPIAEWDGYFHGSYHIYGHIHNNRKNRVFGYLKDEERALNAGADVINFTPATFEELIEYNKEFRDID